jgi:hypothetical protein
MRPGRGRWWQRDAATGSSAGYTDVLDRAGLFTTDELARHHLRDGADPDGCSVVVDARVLVGPTVRLLAKLGKLRHSHGHQPDELGTHTDPADGTPAEQLQGYTALVEADDELRALRWALIRMRANLLERNRIALSQCDERVQSVVDAAMRWICGLEGDAAEARRAAEQRPHTVTSAEAARLLASLYPGERELGPLLELLHRQHAARLQVEAAKGDSTALQLLELDTRAQLRQLLVGVLGPLAAVLPRADVQQLLGTVLAALFDVTSTLESLLDGNLVEPQACPTVQGVVQQLRTMRAALVTAGLEGASTEALASLHGTPLQRAASALADARVQALGARQVLHHVREASSAALTAAICGTPGNLTNRLDELARVSSAGVDALRSLHALVDAAHGVVHAEAERRAVMPAELVLHTPGQLDPDRAAEYRERLLEISRSASAPRMIVAGDMGEQVELPGDERRARRALELISSVLGDTSDPQQAVDEARTVIAALAEGDEHLLASTEALDNLAALSGVPSWDYPGQVVRDVFYLVRDARACADDEALQALLRDRCRAAGLSPDLARLALQPTTTTNS